jgi:hypothetical protein
MSVQRFRSAAEAEEALIHGAHAGDRVARARFLLALVARLAPRRYPVGVRRYRSLEEAACDRQQWHEEWVRNLRQHRAG